MSWKHLKIFAIVALFVMDIVFLLFVIERKSSVLYYDDTLIEASETVFYEGGLHIDRSFLKERKKTPPVYTGLISQDDFSSVMQTMAHLGYLSQEETGGLRFIGENGEFFFGNDFGFTYLADEKTKLPSERMEESLPTALSDGEEKEGVFQTALAFLKKHALVSDTIVRYDYRISCRYVYVLGGEYVVHLTQSVGGMTLEEGLYLLIENGKVVSADGTFSVLLPKEKKSAETAGLLNILFEELSYIKVSEDEASDYTVSDISYSYGLYFDSNDVFYLIPLCKITYQSGETRIYNFVSGKLYS